MEYIYIGWSNTIKSICAYFLKKPTCKVNMHECTVKVLYFERNKNPKTKAIKTKRRGKRSTSITPGGIIIDQHVELQTLLDKIMVN